MSNIRDKFEEAITELVGIGTNSKDYDYLTGIDLAAIACEEIHKEESIKFAKWYDDLLTYGRDPLVTIDEFYSEYLTQLNNK